MRGALTVAACCADLDSFRVEARRLLALEVRPESVQWVDANAAQQSLLEVQVAPSSGADHPAPRVPLAFVKRAERIAHLRDEGRWALLYRILWRLTHGEPELLGRVADADVRRLELGERAVTKDEHRMHAFVRFQRLEDEEGEHYVTWYRPDHPILRLTAPFFARRFAAMRWSILTPDESVTWDLEALRYGPGVPRTEAPSADALEPLWKTYYASVFNPARLNLSAMKRDMPLRYWSTMPELGQVGALVAAAPERTRSMLSAHDRSEAEAFLPVLPHGVEPTLAQVGAALHGCTACPLHANATQAVFGEGPGDAELVLIGEQPGDQEDLEGRPFVGPAGQVLDEALREAGIDRARVYLTNAVKHFKWTPGIDGLGEKRRIHERPGRGEIRACKAWVRTELQLIKPRRVVCLGATAASALMGPGFRLTHSRGQVFQLPELPWILATWHPSAVLRQQDEAGSDRVRAELIADLRTAAS